MSINTDLLRRLTQKINSLEDEVKELQRATQYIYIIKTTAGTPASGASGMIVENTNDNTIHIYAFGAWRQVFP